MNFQVINKSQDTALKVGIIFLGLLIIVGIVLLVVFESQHKNCKDLEGPLCLTGNCRAKSSACGFAPFKIESGGKAVCKTALVNQQNIPTVQFANSA